MKIRIACRESELAQIQAKIVGEQLLGEFEAYELVLCSTLADRKQDSTLAKLGGKGLFVKEVEQALLMQEADIAVHSLKDMPVVQPVELPIVAISARESVHDVLIGANSLQDLPENSTIGTCSPRRAFQLKLLRPDLNVVPIRGNINTRIAKIGNHGIQAIILAEAGIIRAKKQMAYHKFTCDEMLPAAGQGALAIQKRPDFSLAPSALKKIHNASTAAAVNSERAIVNYLGANCHSPLAVFADCLQNKKIIQVRAGDIHNSENCKFITEADDFSAAVREMQVKIDKSIIRKILSNH